MNGLEAAAAVEQLGFDLASIAQASLKLKAVPGRLELIDTNKPFKVLVDYAPEPASMAALYSVLPSFKARRIIHVFGSAGGGRDQARRPILGKFVAERSDVAIVTNEDPYDEPPEKIIDQIVSGTQQSQPRKAQVEKIVDRRQAIQRALSMAQPGDLIVVTGKACEQWIVGPHGTKTAWDDRRVIRELLEP
ncbi:MAG: UDP-N-acetylmuramoyl-L-alanyl-D-glutamate-2,6-diaminopimelate ligase [Candidatus Giovannonibacteria bacterium GW2011_GWA2_53_7]|uniref:UDP-N-acetylmuramoyl-L-alanyl-D-glutamate-2, 6-diaminopimelate ligase n=1 Tax=Candidatus Giovannonibacteria bacterium GW2011_GWA2_53_7 TaxID=1618650 RepID=A0A0G1XWF3_9BACT|nr:MAG: UDP-N-acetylmuramoyl-L-alanyl-D-glutamate-2,6-diaminopimelate ligase [Candidatus Giovannonibacteria bacterium GW2011_GWA2_53_7]